MTKLPKPEPRVKRKSYLPKDANGKIAAGPGRPKGQVNKVTREAKEMIALAFEGLGGLDALIATANKSDSMRMTFYTQLYAKLIPVSVQGQVDVNVEDGQAIAALERLILGVRTARLASGSTEEAPVIIEHESDTGATPQLVLSSKTRTEAA